MELGAAPDDAVVLMAARFERWKGHDVLRQGRRAACRTDRPWRIWIAGAAQTSAEQRYASRGRVGDRGAGAPLRRRIALLGERNDVPTLMRLADIYCQPNLKGEPFGIAIAEAMRSSLPCVVSGGGGAAELLDESCGDRDRAGRHGGRRGGAAGPDCRCAGLRTRHGRGRREAAPRS